MALTALVLAGHRTGTDDPLAHLNATHKGLIEIAGKPMLERVLTTLQTAQRIDRIYITAPEDVREALQNITYKASTAGNALIDFIDVRPSPAQTIAAAIASIETDDGLLVTTSDHPLLSVSMIDEFLDSLGEGNIDAAAACVQRSTYESAYPNTRRTFIDLKDFSFSGANLFWFSGKEALPLMTFWQRLEANRKKPLTMAIEIGPIVGIKYFLGILTKRNLQDRLRAVSDIDVELVALHEAEAAIDVDKPEDITIVEEILRKRSDTI